MIGAATTRRDSPGGRPRRLQRGDSGLSACQINSPLSCGRTLTQTLEVQLGAGRGRGPPRRQAALRCARLGPTLWRGRGGAPHKNYGHLPEQQSCCDQDEGLPGQQPLHLGGRQQRGGCLPEKCGQRAHAVVFLLLQAARWEGLLHSLGDGLRSDLERGPSKYISKFKGKYANTNFEGSLYRPLAQLKENRGW